MLLTKLSAASSLAELNERLQELSKELGASVACYAKYDELQQTLALNGNQLALTSDSQPGLAALTLRAVDDSNLKWPPELGTHLDFHLSYRTSIPIMHWGSLSAILMLGFEDDPQPEARTKIDELIGILEIIGFEVDRNEQQEAFLLRAQEFLVHAVEAQGVSGHVERCSKVAIALASMLDCSAQAKRELMAASQYHDIGLLCFSDPQSPSAVREHTLRGAKLLSVHPELRGIAPIVESHHERYDGSGLPFGKKQNELPLEAWILSLTEDLVESWEGSSGSFTIRIRPFFTEKAKHHHPDVVDALCGLVDSEKLEGLLDG